MASDAKAGRIRKFLPGIDKETYCANTIGNGLAGMDVKTLQDELSLVDTYPRSCVAIKPMEAQSILALYVDSE